MRVCWLRQFAVAGMTVVLALGIVASRAVAKDADPGPGADGGANKDTGKGKVDPAASAFKLPSGVTLNAKQRAAYDDLKAAKEQELRDAIEDAKNAHSGAATAQAVKKVKECRAEIRKAIDDILNGTAPEQGRRTKPATGAARKVREVPTRHSMAVTAPLIPAIIRSAIAHTATTHTVITPMATIPIIITLTDPIRARARRDPVRLPAEIAHRSTDRPIDPPLHRPGKSRREADLITA